MTIDYQKGIVDAGSDPEVDADVIMTAAIAGYALVRLRASKNVKFDVEVRDAYRVGLELNDADFVLTRKIVERLNTLLTAGGYAGGALCQVGVTPIWNGLDQRGNPITRIVGGSGDMDTQARERYEPALPQGVAAKLFALANVPSVGYQGRGAYTGIVVGRVETSQPNLMCTFRHTMPTEGWGRRWHPKDDVKPTSPDGRSSRPEPEPSRRLHLGSALTAHPGVAPRTWPAGKIPG